MDTAPRRRRWVAALTLAFLLPLCTRIAAEDPPMSQPSLPSMPTQDIFPDEILAREFEHRKSVPFEDETLALSLSSRTDWKWVPVTSDTKGHHNRMVTLARVEPPGDPDVAIEMKYILLRHEVRLEDWIDYFLDVQGMTALVGHHGDYSGRHVVDVIAEYAAEDGRPFLARMGFLKNADRIWLVAGTAPREKYERWSREFGVAVVGSSPRHLLPGEYAEPLIEHRVESPRAFTFRCPKTWKTRVPGDIPDGTGALDLYWDDAERPHGVIKVRAYSRKIFPDFNAEKATWSVFEEIRAGAPDLKMRDKLREVEAEHPDFPGGGRVTVYSISLGGKPVEVHELVLLHPEMVVSLVLVSSAELHSRPAHLANHRAWDLAGRTLKLAP